MLDLLNQIDAIVWGPWLLVLLVGTGVYLTIRLGFLQMVKLPRALRLIFFARNKGDGDIDSFKALCTALAATVGTGNIVGVATAIKLGGPGALFWMWVAAFFGMATKYAEGCLAVKFRSIDENGNIAQKTEENIGPYELHDFFLYNFVRFGFSKEKLIMLAQKAFEDKYSPAVIEKWASVFMRRFFISQFKRSCIPDSPKVGSVSLSPRGDWRMPSDASFNAFV